MVFGRRGKTRGYLIGVHLAAPLQPVHRGIWFESPLVEALARRAAGCVVVDSGTTLTDDRWLDGSDMVIGVPIPGPEPRTVRDFVLAEVARLGAPRGSYVDLGHERESTGTWHVSTVRLDGSGPPVRLDDTEVPRNDEVDGLMTRLDAALAEHGQVRSWEVRRGLSLVHVFGPTRDALTAALGAAIRRDPLAERLHFADWK